MNKRDFLTQQAKRLSLLKGAPQDLDAKRAWIDSAETILIEIGEQRFQATVERCIRELQFFPMPATFRELIPAVHNDGMSYKRTLQTTCTICDRVPYGFVWKECTHPDSGRHYQALARCDHPAGGLR